jgi:hypothetical protein
VGIGVLFKKKKTASCMFSRISNFFGLADCTKAELFIISQEQYKAMPPYQQYEVMVPLISAKI